MCRCTALTENVEPGQGRPDGYHEPPLVTLGVDLTGAADLLVVHPGGWTATQAFDYLTTADLGLSHESSDTDGRLWPAFAEYGAPPNLSLLRRDYAGWSRYRGDGLDAAKRGRDEAIGSVLAVVYERGFVMTVKSLGRDATEDAPAGEAFRGVALPVRWRRLGGTQDPVPVGRIPRDVDRGRRVGIALSRISYRLRFRGEANVPISGPVVVVANHTTFMDGPILAGGVPRRISFLIKAEVLWGPLGWFLRTVGQYGIDRVTPQRDVLLASLTQLKAGGVIGIFPEGRRTDGSVSEVFNGAGWLAARAGATVVPVAVRGSARPAGRHIPRFRPGVRAVIGEAFTIPQGAGRAAINAATATIKQHLAELVAELDREIAERIKRRAPRGRRLQRS